jgi:hypothetical protein
VGAVSLSPHVQMALLHMHSCIPTLPNGRIHCSYGCSIPQPPCSGSSSQRLPATCQPQLLVAVKDQHTSHFKSGCVRQPWTVNTRSLHISFCKVWQQHTCINAGCMYMYVLHHDQLLQNAAAPARSYMQSHPGHSRALSVAIVVKKHPDASMEELC